MYEIQADVSAGMMCYSPRESEWDADISHGSRDSPLNAAVIKVDWAGGGLGWWWTGLVDRRMASATGQLQDVLRLSVTTRCCRRSLPDAVPLSRLTLASQEFVVTPAQSCPTAVDDVASSPPTRLDRRASADQPRRLFGRLSDPDDRLTTSGLFRRTSGNAAAPNNRSRRSVSAATMMTW